MYVYFIKCGSKRGPVKIGIASNVERRLAALQIASPFTLKIQKTIKARSRKHAEAMEKWFHHRYRRKWIRGEWFTHIKLEKIENQINNALSLEDDKTGRGLHDRSVDEDYKNHLNHPQKRIDSIAEQRSIQIEENKDDKQ